MPKKAQPGHLPELWAMLSIGVVNLETFSQHLHEVEGMPPIAIFWIERDRIIPPKHAYDVANVVDGITLETFSDCGHYLHHENPSLVAQKI